ncbi:hypothetical protein YC2023_087591 [Brassica napus]
MLAYAFAYHLLQEMGGDELYEAVSVSRPHILDTTSEATFIISPVNSSSGFRTNRAQSPRTPTITIPVSATISSTSSSLVSPNVFSVLSSICEKIYG